MTSSEVVRSVRERMGPVGVWLGVLGRAPIDEERRAALVDVFRLAARSLAPEGRPPPTVAGATAWQALLIALDRLGGSGVIAFGRLPFISERLLELLIAEAKIQLPRRPDTGRSQIA